MLSQVRINSIRTEHMLEQVEPRYYDYITHGHNYYQIPKANGRIS